MAKNILITGGGGFIGINTALYYIEKKENVTVLDNFSRLGSRENIKFLKNKYKSNLKIVEADIRDNNNLLQRSIEHADVVIHLAGQVAVTTSVENPREDFEINALGTFNLLEAARKSKRNPIFIYSSTNKVYGNLEHQKISTNSKRYKFKNLDDGISEDTPTDFYSPYGCSKGAAEQYVHDYNRIYGLKTIVFRQSCIYGPHQFGIEDQGWIAWFIIATFLNKKIKIFGDGKQVRDLLYVDDLIRGYDLAIKNINKTQGQIYNVGGGVKNSISIWIELEPILSSLFEKKIKVSFSKERPGDQKIFISNTKKAKKDFGWEPEVGVEEGIKNLYDWVNENKEMLERVHSK